MGKRSPNGEKGSGGEGGKHAQAVLEGRDFDELSEAVQTMLKEILAYAEEVSNEAICTQPLEYALHNIFRWLSGNSHRGLVVARCETTSFVLRQVRYRPKGDAQAF